MTQRPATKIIVRSWPTALMALAAGLALSLFPELATARVWGVCVSSCLPSVS